MKKIILFFVLFAGISSISFAQSFKLAAGTNKNLSDTIFVKTTNDGGEPIVVDFYIWFQNITSSTQNVTFSQKTLSEAKGVTWCGSDFSDPTCYTSDGGSEAFTIDAGDNKKAKFHIDYAIASTDTGYVRYTLKNVINSNDSASVVVCFSPTATTTQGILDSVLSASAPALLAKEIKWNAYPNPANNFINISYTLPNGFTSGKAIIRNMVGNTVKEVSLTGSTGKVSISTKDYSSGIYFYSLLLNEKVITTKKVIVKNN